MKQPKVSIIMPVYNAQKYIDRCIKSLLDQTFKDFELLMVDDQSQDDSLKLLKKYKDKRITVFQNKQNMGVARTVS